MLFVDTCQHRAAHIDQTPDSTWQSYRHRRRCSRTCRGAQEESLGPCEKQSSIALGHCCRVDIKRCPCAAPTRSMNFDSSAAKERHASVDDCSPDDLRAVLAQCQDSTISSEQRGTAGTIHEDSIAQRQQLPSTTGRSVAECSRGLWARRVDLSHALV